MSYAEESRQQFEKYARGGNTTQTVGNTTTYTTTENTRIVGGQTYVTGGQSGVGQTYVTGGSGVRGQSIVTGQNIVGQTVTSPLYQTTYTTQPTVVGGQTVYNGQASYSNGPQDYKLVNQTFQTSTGGYSAIGQSLTQKVVA